MTRTRVADRATRVALAASLTLCALAAPGWAGDTAAADALFRQGRQLLEEGKTELACRRFDESQRLDPSSGTLLNLASCHHLLGRTASARAEFLEAARLAKRQDKPSHAEEADRRAAALEAEVSHVLVSLAAPPPGLEVRVNGVRLKPEELGSRFAVDPGEVSIVANAPERVPWTIKVVVGPKADVQTVRIPELDLVRKSAPAASGSAHAPPPAPVPAAPPSRTAAYVVGGIGIVSLGVGAVFGLRSLSAYKEAERLCPSHAGCPQAAVDESKNAELRANISNVAVGVGVAGLGLGTYLWITSGSGREGAPARSPASLRLSPVLGPGVGLAVVEGAFSLPAGAP
jgi:tetratricopeptide (TPR) repeat protein